MTHTLGEMAAFLEGELQGPAELIIEGIAPIDQATPREITFITQKRFARLADQSRAAAFIVSREHAGLARPLIIVAHPYLAYARVAVLFAPPVRRWPGVSDLACLGPDVALGEGVSIAPLVFIGAGVRLGDRVTVMPGCVINDEVIIGADTLIYPNVTIRERCTLYPGRVGSGEPQGNLDLGTSRAFGQSLQRGDSGQYCLYRLWVGGLIYVRYQRPRESGTARAVQHARLDHRSCHLRRGAVPVPR